MNASGSFLSRRAFAAFSVAALPLAVAGCSASASAITPEDRTSRNVRVSDDLFAAHIEPSVAANPRDPANLLAACRVFQGAAIGIATNVSFDSGRTWRSNGLLPGLAPDFDGNAVVAFDGRGRGFVCGIEATTEQPRHGDARLWRTDDGGRSFHHPVTAIAAGTGLADHPGLAIDRWAPPRSSGIYLAAVLTGASRNGLVFCRSADGGRSFEPPRFVDPASGSNTIAPVLAAGPGGAVSMVYFVATADAVVLTALSSTDHGKTFAAPVSMASITSLAPGLGIVSAKSGPAIAAAPRSGYVYAATTSFDETAGRSKVIVCCSPDQGRTWSSPAAARASTREIYLQPQLAVDAAGRIGLSAYAVSIEDRRINVMFQVSPPGPARFAAPRRITTRSFDPTLAIDTGSTRWLGNYQGLTAAVGAFHPIWTDTRAGNAQIFTATARS